MSGRPVKSLKNCPVCLDPAVNAERVLRDAVGFGAGELLYSVDLCPRCGAIYSVDRSQCDELYDPDSDLERRHGHQVRVTDETIEAVWNYQNKLLQAREVLSFVQDRTIRYLEVGASDGSLFRVLDYLCRKTAVDLSGVLIESTGAAECCGGMDNCTPATASVLAPELLPGEGFTVAVLSHCLEHFDEPRAVLRRVRQWLADGALLYLEVPDGTRYDFSVSFPLGYYHVVNYNLANLNAMVASLGFDVVDVLQRHTYPGIRLVARKSDRERPFRVGEEAAVWGRSVLAEWQRNRTENLARLREQLAASPGKLLVYGAGTHTRALVREFPEWLGGDTADFSDSSPDLKRFMGRELVSPKALDFHQYAKVIVSSYAYQEEIEQQLVARGCDPAKILKLYQNVFSYVAPD